MRSRRRGADPVRARRRRTSGSSPARDRRRRPRPRRTRRPGARPRPRHRLAGGHRAGRVRRLAQAARRARHRHGRRGARRRRCTTPSTATPSARRPRRPWRASRSMFTADWPTSAEVWLPGGKPPAPGSRLTQPGARRHVPADPRRGRGRRPGPGRADRRGPARLVAGVRRRGGRRLVRGPGGARHVRAPAPGPAHRRRPGALVDPERGAGDAPGTATGGCSRPARGARARCSSSSSACSAATTWARSTRRARLRPPRHRGRQARLRRPGGVVRRHRDVPLAALLDPAYATARRALIGASASLELRPGSPGRAPRLRRPCPVWPRRPGRRAHRRPGSASPRRAPPAARLRRHLPRRRGRPLGQHRLGHPVRRLAAEQPRSSPPSASRWAPAGRCSGWSEGLPNSLAPGKRPRTTLSPSMARRPDGGLVAFGTPGGDQQDQWSLVFFLRLVHHGRNLQEAIDLPMFHSTHAPSSFYPRDARSGRDPRGVTGARGDPRGAGATRAPGRSWRTRGRSAGSARHGTTRRAVSCMPAPTRAGCRDTRSAAERANRPGVSLRGLRQAPANPREDARAAACLPRR